MEKLVFSVLAVLIAVLILAGCEKAPAPATDPVPTPQESLSSEESQSSSVYVKEPQTTVFDGRSYTCTGYNTYTDDETGDCYYFYDIFASADEKSAEPSAAVIRIIVNYSKKPTRYVAVIRQNGEIKEWFEIKDFEIRNLPESDEIAPPEITFDESAKILTAKTGEHPTYNVLVNFEKQTAEAWFSDIKEEYLEFTEKVSSNGKYSLYEGAFHGGGDIAFSSVFLKDNSTNEFRYFRECGGMYGGFNFYGFLKNGKHNWYSDRKQTTLWNYDKPSRNANHPTSKPLDLLGYPIGNSSQENGIIIDTFGGSGSTLMACEQTNRICYTMELDEKYASVILRRYVEDTGDADGVSVERDGERIPYSELVKEVDRNAE